MNADDVNRFLDFCTNQGVMYANLSPAMQQAMCNFYTATKALPPGETVVDAPTVVATVSPTTKLYVKVLKNSPASKLSSNENGFYEFRGRRAFNATNAHIFKVVILDMNLPALGKQKSPFTSELDGDVKSAIEKIWNTNPDLFGIKDFHGNRGHQDTSISIGKAHFSFANNGAIKKITQIIWYPQAGLIATPTAPPIVTKTIKTQSKLNAFSVNIDKDDPILLGDKMLNLWKYNFKTTNILDNDQEVIRGRLGEIGLHIKYDMLEWINKDMELVGHSDFRVPGSNLTLDVKTIMEIHNNLLLKKKKVDSNNLADIFALALVEDMGTFFRVTFLGYINKLDSLNYIAAYPPCYMKNLDSYKIDRRQLETSIVIDI
jgi:hypothetical protein